MARKSTVKVVVSNDGTGEENGTPVIFARLQKNVL